jgi:hypothetical protein
MASAAELCPYGQPGTKLWVRENFRLGKGYDDGGKPSDAPPFASIHYEADGPAPDWAGRLRPSIFLPRWASRITLVVDAVRMERLHAITAEDAKAEGLSTITKDGGRTWKFGIPDRDGLPGTDNTGWPWADWDVDPRRAFERLWRSINGDASWDANPWVWVVGFSIVEVRK